MVEQVKSNKSKKQKNVSNGRTMKLTMEQRNELRSRAYSFDTMTQAAIELKIGRDVLINTLLRGSCSVSTYKTLFSNTSN